MGYTHYWTPKKATAEKWNKFIEVAKELKSNLPKYSESAGGCYGEDAANWKRVLKISGGMGTGKPNFNQKEVWFNGDEKRGLDHETFFIAPDKNEWNFCKTARKPYDLLVCAVLIAAYEYLDYDVSSDGRLEDWLPAIEYYSTVVYGRPKAVLNFGKDLRETILPDFLYKESIEYKRALRVS